MTWSIRLIHSQASRVSQITLWTSTIPSKVLSFTFTSLFRVHTPGWIISVVRRKVCSIDWYFLLSPSKLNLTILVSGNKTNKQNKCREVRTGVKVIRVIYISSLTRTRMEWINFSYLHSWSGWLYRRYWETLQSGVCRTFAFIASVINLARTILQGLISYNPFYHFQHFHQQFSQDIWRQRKGNQSCPSFISNE